MDKLRITVRSVPIQEQEQGFHRWRIQEKWLACSSFITMTSTVNISPYTIVRNVPRVVDFV